MSASLPHLYVADIVAGYVPDVPILRGAGLRVNAGELVAVLGPNGAGKSTLIKAIAGMVPVSAGDIRVSGKSIRGIATHRLIEARVAYVPQTNNVFTRLSVAENLELGCIAEPAQTRERIEETYRLFPDLARLRGLPAGKLSGGQRQMVAIGRALMARPQLIMLDEPSAGLSPKMTQMVFEKLLEIRAGGVSLLLVEQNAKAALSICDRGYVLAEGKERFTGSGAELLASPEIGALYLGAHSRLAS